MAQNSSEIRYLVPPTVDTKKKKYCCFKKSGIKFIDYKDSNSFKSFSTNRERSCPAALPHFR